MKFSLSNILSGFQLSRINTNFDKIETELNNKVLYRDNPEGEPNTMEQDLDMNGNAVLNASVVSASSLRLNGVDVEVGQATTSAATIQAFPFTATAGQTEKDVSPLEPTTSAVLVIVNGFMLSSTDLSIAGSLVSFPALEEGDEVTVYVFTRDVGGATNASSIVYNSRTVASKLDEIPSVKDNGAVGDGVVDDTAAVQAAYDAAADGETILIPNGNYNVGSVTGTKDIHWLSLGAVDGSIPVSLPGIMETFYQGRKLFNQTSSAGDDYSVVQIQRDANYTGGTAGFVNSGLRVNTTIRSGVTAYEWAIVGLVDNYSASGEPTGVYAQGIRRSGAGPVWGAVSEARDETGLANPAVGLVGLEVDVWANGTDTNSARVGADITIGRPTGTHAAGSQCEAGYGIRVIAKNNSSAEGRVKRAISVALDCDVAFDASQATFSGGGVAFRMGNGHKFSLTSTNDRYFTYASSALQYWNGGGTPAFSVADSTNTLNVFGPIQVLGTQVITSRRTGWGAPTGTATRTTFATGGVTLPQLAERVKALIDDLTTHGLIGT